MFVPRLSRFALLSFPCIFFLACCLQANASSAYVDNVAPDNPAIATYDEARITLRQMEEFIREMPISERIPFLDQAGGWRLFACRELAKDVVFTSKALSMGIQMDPSFLRARDYFIQEYLDYLVLRDELTNKMDVSLDAQQHEYDTHKQDYWLSSTVALRVIRTRSLDRATSAAKRIAAGEDFVKVEADLSEVSPRYIGRIMGPYPALKPRMEIPPPAQAIEAAKQMDAGQTTGPLKIGQFYFVIKTEAKTKGHQQSLSDVAEQVETALRIQQTDAILPSLVQKIQQDLGAAVDENLFAAGTSDNDLLATVGAVKIYRREYSDLNGNVRGPALAIAQRMPTKLKQFVIPYMLAEWARVHGFSDRAETANAVRYYDLQHLAGKVVDHETQLSMTPPTDEVLRARFRDHIAEFQKLSGVKDPPYDKYRDEVLQTYMMEQRPAAQQRLVDAELAKHHFAMVPSPQDSYITAFEAVVAAGDKLPSGTRLLDISQTEVTGDDSGTSYVDIGRAPGWRITYLSPQGAMSEQIIKGPALLSQDNAKFTGAPAYVPFKTLWRFDTDSLKRHAVDKGLGDFLARYDHRIRVSANVAFAWSKDDPTSPTDCVITYTAAPLDGTIHDGMVLKYSGSTGDITKRRVGEPEGKCPTCPAPDLPSKIIEHRVSGSAPVSETSATATQAASTSDTDSKGA
jgi:hypothetical protein